MQPNHVSVPAGAIAPRWLESPLSQILDHILHTYHAPLREDLARIHLLISQARATPRGCSVERQAILEEIWQCFSTLREELELHMEKEEQVLFPWIRAGRSASAKAPIKVMQHDHKQTEELLARLGKLRERYIPLMDGAQATQSIVQGLAAIDDSVREHIRLEELVIHRALAS